MSDLQTRSTQTIVKHLILEDYLARWGGIIIQGLKKTFERVANFRCRFVYVDAFSFEGRYASESLDGKPVYGSPIIGITALDQLRQEARTKIGFEPETICILIEKEQPRYNELLNTLEMANLSSRITQTTNFASLRDGQIAVVREDFLNYAELLLNFTGMQYTYSFYLLDPYGPSGIPLQVVKPIICQDHTDVMINFPYQDLHKKTGSVSQESSIHEPHLRHYDQLYGSSEWRQIAQNRNLESAELEIRLVDLYSDVLQTQDSGLAIKSVRLRFPEKERTMFYLYLTTHDPTGALAINQILDNAKLAEHNLRVEWKNEKFRGRSGGFAQQPLFDVAPTPISSKPTCEDIAEHIYQLCKGERIEYREVLRRLVNEPYYHNDIKSAMTILKRQKKANYQALRNPETISFSR